MAHYSRRITIHFAGQRETECALTLCGKPTLQDKGIRVDRQSYPRQTPRTRQAAHASGYVDMSKHDEPKTDRAKEIRAMLARIPIDLLEQEGLRLLQATRHVSQGRDLPMVEEPDNAIRAKIWLACIEQEAGTAPAREKIATPKDEGDTDKPNPGKLRGKAH